MIVWLLMFGHHKYVKYNQRLIKKDWLSSSYGVYSFQNREMLLRQITVDLSSITVILLLFEIQMVVERSLFFSNLLAFSTFL